MDPAVTAFSESTVFYLALITIFGFLALVGGLIWIYGKSQDRNLRQQAKMNQREIEYQKQLLAASVRGQEAERKRLAQELHDGVSTPLGLIKMKLAMQAPAAVGTNIGGEIEKVISEVRTTSHDLLPPAFEDRGLVSATQGLCDRFADLELFDVQFSCNEPDRRFAPERELNVYRIVQELMNNCRKYAEAQRVAVSLQFNGPELTMRYEDNGKGFEYQPISKADAALLAEAGLGLYSIQTRADLLGGALQYETAPRQGVQVQLQLNITSDGAGEGAD